MSGVVSVLRGHGPGTPHRKVFRSCEFRWSPLEDLVGRRHLLRSLYREHLERAVSRAAGDGRDIALRRSDDGARPARTFQVSDLKGLFSAPLRKPVLS
jgi:hypothetical protein